MSKQLVTKSLLILGLACIGLQIIDGLTTYIGVIELGFEECTPNAKALIDAYGGLGIVISKGFCILLVSIAVISPVIIDWLMKNIMKMDYSKELVHNGVKTILIVSNAIYIYVIANNIYWLTLWAMNAL